MYELNLDIKTAKDNDLMYTVKYMYFYTITLRDGPFDFLRGWAGVFCR